jgi:L-ascorbate metabolism protein UlaG (beta-lactamase superfamily)
MNEPLVYLRPNSVVEPLVDRWYAWSHLIPPATAARNLTERHLKIMNSYLDAPQVHAAAVKNPQMVGGPFMDFAKDCTREVRELRDQTVRKRSAHVALSRDIGLLDGMLRTQAKGFSLEPLYSRVPPTLKGYVELVYDLNNQPAFRLLESLLYRSSYYDPSAQSLRLSAIASDDRPFVLSTPRLDGESTVYMPVPFSHEAVDALFAMASRPDRVCRIAEMAGISERDRPALATYTTSERPRPYVPYDGPGFRWRYFGHACILLETRGFAALFDPVVSYTYETDLRRYTYEDLPERLDVVFVTHNHQDHILFETLLRLRGRIGSLVVPRGGAGNLVDPSLKLLLRRCGFRNVIELDEMEELEFEGGSVVGIPFLGEHADLNVKSKLAYLLRLNGHSLMFAADSRNVEPELYVHVRRTAGEVDVLFLGMECDGAPLSWVYGPLLTQKLDRAMDHSRRLAGSDYDRAIRIVEELNCREVYVYAMGQEPWLNHVMSIKYTAESRPIVESNRLVSECRNRGIQAERLYGEREIRRLNRRSATMVV